MNLFAQLTEASGSPSVGIYIDLFTMIVGLAILLALIIGLYVVHSYLLGRIFKKAGIDAWRAWVPVYNNWVLLEMGGQQGWWAVVALVPPIGLVALIPMLIASYKISAGFGKSGAFFLLAIFIPVLWMAWLGLDNSMWKGKPAATLAASADQVSPEPRDDTGAA